MQYVRHTTVAAMVGIVGFGLAAKLRWHLTNTRLSARLLDDLEALDVDDVDEVDAPAREEVAGSEGSVSGPKDARAPTRSVGTMTGSRKGGSRKGENAGSRSQKTSKHKRPDTRSVGTGDTDTKSERDERVAEVLASASPTVGDAALVVWKPPRIPDEEPCKKVLRQGPPDPPKRNPLIVTGRVKRRNDLITRYLTQAKVRFGTPSAGKDNLSAVRRFVGRCMEQDRADGYLALRRADQLPVMNRVVAAVFVPTQDEVDAARGLDGVWSWLRLKVYGWTSIGAQRI